MADGQMCRALCAVHERAVGLGTCFVSESLGRLVGSPRCENAEGLLVVARVEKVSASMIVRLEAEAPLGASDKAVLDGLAFALDVDRDSISNLIVARWNGDHGRRLEAVDVDVHISYEVRVPEDRTAAQVARQIVNLASMQTTPCKALQQRLLEYGISLLELRHETIPRIFADESNFAAGAKPLVLGSEEAQTAGSPLSLIIIALGVFMCLICVSVCLCMKMRYRKKRQQGEALSGTSMKDIDLESGTPTTTTRAPEDEDLPDEDDVVVDVDDAFGVLAKEGDVIFGRLALWAPPPPRSRSRTGSFRDHRPRDIHIQSNWEADDPLSPMSSTSSMTSPSSVGSASSASMAGELFLRTPKRATSPGSASGTTPSRSTGLLEPVYEDSAMSSTHSSSPSRSLGNFSSPQGPRGSGSPSSSGFDIDLGPVSLSLSPNRMLSLNLGVVAEPLLATAIEWLGRVSPPTSPPPTKRFPNGPFAGKEQKTISYA